jgi:hypothetical protein
MEQPMATLFWENGEKRYGLTCEHVFPDDFPKEKRIGSLLYTLGSEIDGTFKKFPIAVVRSIADDLDALIMEVISSGKTNEEQVPEALEANEDRRTNDNGKPLEVSTS